MFPHIPIKYDTFWLTKVAFPIFLVVIIGWLYLATNDNRKCENICQEKDFADSRYKHAGKYNSSPGICRCFTAEETEIKNRIPEGVQVPLQ